MWREGEAGSTDHRGQVAEQRGAGHTGFQKVVFPSRVFPVANNEYDAAVDPDPKDQRHNDDVGEIERDGEQHRCGGREKEGERHGGEYQKGLGSASETDEDKREDDDHRVKRGLPERGRDGPACFVNRHWCVGSVRRY